MRKIMLFIVAICLILFLSSCESDAPMEILNGLEAEDLVLEELKEETHQVVKINDVYSYSLTIETIFISMFLFGMDSIQSD